MNNSIAAAVKDGSLSLSVRKLAGGSAPHHLGGCALTTESRLCAERPSRATAHRSLPRLTKSGADRVKMPHFSPPPLRHLVCSFSGWVQWGMRMTTDSFGMPQNAGR